MADIQKATITELLKILFKQHPMAIFSVVINAVVFFTCYNLYKDLRTDQKVNHAVELRSIEATNKQTAAIEKITDLIRTNKVLIDNQLKTDREYQSIQFVAIHQKLDNFKE